MMQKNIKRCLSLMLALALSFSLLPVGAVAAEGEAEEQSLVTENTSSTEVTTAPTEETVEIPTEAAAETTAPVVVTVEKNAPVVAAAETTAIQTVQSKMDGILEYYLGTTDLTVEEAVALVAELNPYDTAAANMEIYEMEISEEYQSLTGEELLILDSNKVFWAFADAVYEKASTEGAISTYGVDTANTDGTTGSLLNGAISVSSRWYVGDWVGQKGTCVITDTVTLTANGGKYTQYESNVTLTNNSGNEAVLSFAYAAGNYSAFTINSVAPSEASGTYTVTLGAGASCTLSITGLVARSDNTATLTLSGFSLVSAESTYDVTLEYNSALGSITAGDNASPSSGYVAEDVSASTGIALTATAGNSTFLGWVNETTHERLTTSTSYTLKPSADCTVRAAFATASSDAWFLVDNTYLTDDLTTATTLGTTIVLMHDGILSAGDYTIPVGDTLLIPFDASGTLYKATPTAAESYTTPSAFRKLTLESGASIIVNGEMSVSGQHSASKPRNGLPTGKQGFVVLKEGSNITVNGTLYAWGYLVSEARTNDTTLPKTGTVTINSSGTVYECFQVTDYRGGDGTSKMPDNEQKVFPMSQYYVQNVQVPMTLHAGATEIGFMSVSVSIVGIQQAPVPFIGTDGLFRISSGSITKDYNELTDRMEIDINGTLTVESMTIDIKVSTIGSISLTSSNYVLPITSSMTVRVHKDSVFTQKYDMALLPGVEIYIEDGATFNVGESGKAANLYVYDEAQWGGYCNSDNQKFCPLNYAYDRVAKRTAESLVDAMIQVDGTLDATYGYVYTTTDGANICSTGAGAFISGTPGTSTKTYQATQSSDTIGQNISYVEIPITPAKLKHGDGTYLATGDADQGSGTYYYHPSHQKWVKGEHVTAKDVVTAPTCTEQGYTTYTCTCGYVYKDTYTAATGHSYDSGVVTTAPTCTATGVKTFTCGTCGDTYTETVDANGHTSGEAVTENSVSATCTASGSYDSVVYCTVCTTELSRETIPVAALGHTEVIDQAVAPAVGVEGKTEGKHCSVCNEVIIAQEIVPALVGGVIYGTNIRAGDSLDLYFYINEEALNNRTDLVAEIVSTKIDPETNQPEQASIPFADWQIYSEDYYRIVYENIAAKEMTDVVTLVINDTEGNQFSEEVKESVQNYAIRALSLNDAELKTMMSDMLNYGAAAQTNFGYKTNALANAGLTLSGSAAVTPNDHWKWLSEIPDGYNLEASVTLEANLIVNFYFTGLAQNAIVKTSYTDHYGKEVTESYTADLNGNLPINVDELAVADGSQIITCTLCDASGNALVDENDTTLQVQGSVEGYVYTVTKDGSTETADLKAVCVELMKFIKSAYAYFH